MEGLALVRQINNVSLKTEIFTINDFNYMDLSIEGMALGIFDGFLIPLDIDSMTKRILETARRSIKRGSIGSDQ